MFSTKFQPPCTCVACVIAGVSMRERPVKPDLHGRDLLRWLQGWDEFKAALAKFGAAKPMPGGGR